MSKEQNRFHVFKKKKKLNYKLDEITFAKWLSRESIVRKEGYDFFSEDSRKNYLNDCKTFKNKEKIVQIENIKETNRFKKGIKEYAVDKTIDGEGLTHKKKLLKNKAFVSGVLKLLIILTMMLFIFIKSITKLNISLNTVWHLVLFTIGMIILALPSILFPYFILKDKKGVEKFRSSKKIKWLITVTGIILTLSLLLSVFYFDYLFRDDVNRAQIANTPWEDRKFIGLYTVGLTLVSFVFKLIQGILWLIKRRVFKTEKSLNSLKLKNTYLFLKQNEILMKNKTDADDEIQKNNYETKIVEQIKEAKELFILLKNERGNNVIEAGVRRGRND